MSRGIEPGDQAPDFELPNANAAVGGGSMTLSDAMGDNGAIVMFTCNHCPYVVGSEGRIENAAARARDPRFEHACDVPEGNSRPPIKLTAVETEVAVEELGDGVDGIAPAPGRGYPHKASINATPDSREDIVPLPAGEMPVALNGSLPLGMTTWPWSHALMVLKAENGCGIG